MSFDLILPFLKPIEHLLLSETVSEIMVNSDSSVWMEEDGRKRLLPDVRFELGALDAGLEVIANRFGKRLGADSPILNLRLPDGSRLAWRKSATAAATSPDPRIPRRTAAISKSSASVDSVWETNCGSKGRTPNTPWVV